ncbi:ABC transporter ATP-binding protein [Mycolicibacterium sp. P9-64]|nr:ABC transporter ATP-binding protein [Mycolicibacterium sp. P9-64]
MPRRIVSDMSMSIGAGEALGVIGESGSGKSMTARTIVRNLPAGSTISGAVTFDGEDVLSMSPNRLRTFRRHDVAMVFQDPRAHINPVRRIGDFLTESLRADGMPPLEARERSIKLLNDVHVANAETVMRRYPHELSGGMLQRVMIASAMSTSPKLLIADEPTTALDVTTQAEVMAILDEMRMLGMALLFITHDLDLASAICDRVSVAYAGRTVETQQAEAMGRRPLHPYTSALLGARPSLSGGEERLKALRGSSISAWETPAGCAFAPRCDFAEDLCSTEQQELLPMGDAWVACRRVDELSVGRVVPGGLKRDV